MAYVQRARIDQQVQRIEFQFCDVLGDRQQSLCGFGQIHAPAPAEKQLHVVLALQRLHLGRQRGLAHAQRPGRRRKAAMARHGQESA
jgi:hypothetical protein